MASKRKRRQNSEDASTAPSAPAIAENAPEPPEDKELEGSGFAEGLGKPILWFSALALALACIKPMMGSGALYDSTPLSLFILSLACVYFIVNSKSLKANYWSWGIPALTMLSALMSYYSNAYGEPLTAHYTYFSMMISVFCLFYALSFYRMLDMEVAIVLALLIATLVIHLPPATADILSNIDSYWHYKWMQPIYNAGYQTEFDPLTYPFRGGIAHNTDWTKYTGPNDGLTFGLTQKQNPMFNAFTYATLALAMRPAGISLYDVAMIFPGICGALAVALMYLLVKELFTGWAPKNKTMAFAAAFMFMLSPALAMNSTATNPKDSGYGMFLTVGTMFLFVAAYRRKSFKYALASGVAMLMLRMGWGGGTYTMFSIGVFATAYAIVKFFQNKNALEHMQYAAFPAVFYQFMGFFAHGMGEAPRFSGIWTNEMYPFIAAMGVSIVLEMVRAMRNGPIFLTEKTLEARTTDFLEKNIKFIGTATIVIGLITLTLYKTPMDWVNYVYQGIASAGSWSIIHQTVAEQNPMATSFSEYITAGYTKYGVALIYGLIMLPILGYLVWKRGEMGALFLITWSLPIMYGAANKSSWIFASSAPVAALGASIALFAAAKKKDLEGYWIIGTILIAVIPILYIPMFGTLDYSRFVGFTPMMMGPSSDNYYWLPMLQWHANNTGPGDAIITWWDYGHWITAVAHRPVIADPLQEDYYEIQDVARFFENKTSEDDAFEIIKTYNDAYKRYNQSWGLKYATIDWTMIPKGSALHYIATGNIENFTPGSYKNYALCEFAPQASQLTEQLVVSENGSFSKVRKITFQCQGYVAGVIFEMDGESIKSITAVDQYNNRIPWDRWSKANDASLLGVQPLIGVNQNERVPGILTCAMNWDNPQYSICRLPQFNTLVYVPQEFNDYMTTRLYLGKYLQQYKDAGLYSHEIAPLKHFREIPDYNNDGTPDGEFSFGYVRSYEIIYEPNDTNAQPDKVTVITG